MEESRRFGSKRVVEDFVEIATTYEKILLALHSRLIQSEESLADVSSKLEMTTENIRELEANVARDHQLAVVKLRRVYFVSISSIGLAATCLVLLLFAR